jgi:hypothetical protein
VEAVDIDGDGDLDVLVANDGENNAMYINEGNGELKKLTEGAFVTDTGMSSRDVEVADLDGDGDMDILVANDGALNAMYLYAGCPGGSARLGGGQSWCFDCPTFTIKKQLGDGAALSRATVRTLRL